MALLLETLWGDLVIDLDVEGSPELCRNILKLAKARYYTNTLIFSVAQNRFCQAGDPVGDGTGGACIYGLTDPDVEDYHQYNKRFLKSVGRPLSVTECREMGRVVATTQGGTADTIGSQFLITISGGLDHALDGYAIATKDNESMTTEFLSLGVVTEDENGVLHKINAAYTDPHGRPYADIRIIRALVIHDPFEDVPGMAALMEKRGVLMEGGRYGRAVDSPSPERPTEEKVAHRISAAEVAIDDNSEDDEELRRKLKAEQEEAARKEDKSRAVVLEMLGDLPDADIRAPEDVLFICKLNPATVDEDLELILSRFDEKVKVEIIRDQDTGASLQYAFAEFTSKKGAEEAYFKMNNALVDDRRIKVDFSQSVAKLWDKYNQKMRMPAVGGFGGGGDGLGERDRGSSRERGRGGGRFNDGRGGRGPYHGRDNNVGSDHGHHDRLPDQHHDHERNIDGFGRGRGARPRDGEAGHDDRRKSEGQDRGHEYRQHREHRRRSRGEDGHEQLGSKHESDEDSRDDRRHSKRRKKEKRKGHNERRHRKKHDRMEQRRRHDSGSSSEESERRHRERKEENRRHRNKDRESGGDAYGDSGSRRRDNKGAEPESERRRESSRELDKARRAGNSNRESEPRHGDRNEERRPHGGQHKKRKSDR